MLAERMANYFSNEGIITDEEKEIVQFGLESMGGNLLGFTMTFVIGFFFRQIGCAMLVWLLLFPLRKNAGGFHASTRVRCFFLSASMMFLAFAIYSISNSSNVFYELSVLVTGSIIWLLVPVDNPSKKLDKAEHKIYRKRSRKILALEGAFFLAAVWFEWKTVVRSTAMTFFLVGMSLVMGAVKLSLCQKTIIEGKDSRML